MKLSKRNLPAQKHAVPMLAVLVDEVLSTSVTLLVGSP